MSKGRERDLDGVASDCISIDPHSKKLIDDLPSLTAARLAITEKIARGDGSIVTNRWSGAAKSYATFGARGFLSQSGQPTV